MSASKKRKEKNAAMESHLTEKQRREEEAKRKEAAKYKMYWATGIVTSALVAALLIWDSGVFQRQATAAVVDGKEYTVSDMSFYYGNVLSSLVSMQNQYSSLYQQLGMTYTSIYDTSVSPKNQEITEDIVVGLGNFGFTDAEVGQTFHEYFQKQALAGLQAEVVLCNGAQAEGYTLSDEGKATVDSTIQGFKDAATSNNYNYKSFLTANFGPYMTPSVFEARVKASTLAGEYDLYKQESYVFDDGDYELYYTENAHTMDSYEYRSALISGVPETKTDEEGNTIEATQEEMDQAMENAKDAADEMVALIQEGATFNEAAAQCVAESSQSLYEDENHGHVTDAIGSNIASTTYGAWLTEGTHKKGDIGIVEDTSGYYVVEYLGRTLDEKTLSSSEIRHILTMAETTDVVIEAEEEGGEDTIVSEPTEEQMEEARSRSEEIEAEYKATAQTAEDFATLADLYSDDPGSNGSTVEAGGGSGGYYEVTTSSSFFADFQEWALDPERTVGETAIIENPQEGQYGYHLMYYQGAGLPVWKQTADTALRTEAYTTWYDEALEQVPASIEYEGMNLLG